MTRFGITLCIILTLNCSIPAIAQITIGSGDAPVIGASMTGTHAGEIVFDPQTPGANRTWDITSYTYELEGVQNWISPQGVTGADQFPTATIVLESPDESGNTYSFMRVANDGVRSIGMSAIIDGSPMTIVFDQEALMLPFPTTFGTEWTMVTSLSVEVAPGMVSQQVDSTRHSIDAWGQMTTLTWSAQALRDLQHEYTFSYFNGQLIGSDEQWNYYWWTNEVGQGVHYSCDGVCDSPNFVNGDLSVGTSGSTSVDPVRGPVASSFAVGQNYPNPFNPSTSLPITLAHSGSVEITIYNELGEVVSAQEYHFTAGDHTVHFDGSSWASGNYFAQVRNASEQQTLRMTLVK